MAERFPYEKAAQALAKADYASVQSVAEEFGVTTRTVTNWKDRRETDPVLKAAYLAVKAEYAKTIASKIPHTVEKIIGFIDSAIEELDPSDPDCVRAMMSAAGELTELMIIMKRMT